jgi:hypothetical protein
MIVPVGETGSIDPTANDTDPDGERSSLRVVSVGQSAFGQTARNGNTVSFTAGPDTTTTNVRYQVADADGATASATIQITIIGDEEENLPPIANDARREVEAPGGPITFDVSSLISDPDDTLDTLEVTNVGRTSSVGEVAWNQFLITLTPPAQPDFAGNVVAAYTVVDKGGLEATGQLTLTVVPPENRPPVANDDSAEVANSGSITVNVLNNDTDPDGDPLTVSINDAPDPAIGTAAVTSGRIAFTATQGASGSATIGYTVSDGELSDNAVLRITVLPCTDSTPIARDAFLETGYLQPITVQLAGYVTNGIVTASQGPPGWADPVYTPPAGENGNVTITYTASNGCAASATGTVTIDVNQQPVAQPQQLALGKNESRTIPVTSLAGDDEPLVITGSTGAPAWVTTTPDGVVIAPPGGTVGTVFSWTTTVQDPGGLTAAVPISVSVSNLPPVAANDLVDASETTGPFMIVANDSDPDDPNSSLRIQSLPSVAQMQVGNASLTLMADGRRILVDTSNGQGIGGFEYTVVDPSGATATALVGIIGPPIPPPTTTTTTTTTTLAPTTTRPQLTIPPTTSPPTTVAPQTTAGDS